MTDWVGTIVTLWDTAVRVATFANDLRAAQDDFIGLRSEAECLLICINSLNAPSCRDTLYRYINVQQAADLKTIVKSTELNMIELNQFLAKCRRVVERHVGRNARLRGAPRRIKEAVAKAWATYRFTMKDKQAFRDKLILPAQSINIYLTMLTHVGLVNVGVLVQLSGHGGGAGAGAGVEGEVGGRVEGEAEGEVEGAVQGGGNDQGGGGAMVNWGPGNRWSVVGRRVAFKDFVVDDSELTSDIEQQIVNYAQYLTRGGMPFQIQSSINGSRRERYRVTKGTTRRSRSRPRSAGQVGIERDSKGQMYMTRKKSVGSLSTKRIEAVDREYGFGWESEGHVGHRRLALPAPE